MSVQTESLIGTPLVNFPWSELEDARDQLQDAERFGTEDEVAKAREYVNLCRQECGELGGLLMILAFEFCSEPLRRVLTREFGQFGVEAYRQSTGAVEMVKALSHKLDALTQRFREMEKRLDNLTPGVGEPGARRMAI